MTQNCPPLHAQSKPYTRITARRLPMVATRPGAFYLILAHREHFLGRREKFVIRILSNLTFGFS